MKIAAWSSKALKVAGASLGALFLMGLGFQSVEWISSRVLATSVERAHRAIGSLRAGMSRPDVERGLASMAPALTRLARLQAGVWSSHFMYTVSEACYVTLEFHDDRLIGVAVSDANQPGHCPGAPPDWRRDEHSSRPSGRTGATASVLGA